MRQALLVMPPKYVQHKRSTTCSTLHCFLFRFTNGLETSHRSCRGGHGHLGHQGWHDPDLHPGGPLAVSHSHCTGGRQQGHAGEKQTSCMPAMLLSLCQNQQGVAL